MPIVKFKYPVIQLVGDKKIAWYNCIATAHGMTGIPASSITDAIRGKVKRAGGYSWKEEKK
jgi:hypothetical protein